MDPKLVAMISLRSLAMLFTLQGRPQQAQSLNLVAAGIESGADVDAHMRGVNDALVASNGDPSDAMWDDVHARIQADSARLQAR